MIISKDYNLIKRAIKELNLNLEDLTILCEAATGYYSYTPIICVLAGAKKVYAFGKETKYAKLNKLKKIHSEIAKSFNAQDKIKFVDVLNKNVIKDCDIILNQGMLRPLDKKKLEYAKETTVIPLMYEAWEFRREDVDLDYCRRKGILVLGTKESNLPVDVFSYCGNLAEKMFNQRGLGIKGKNILIIGKNRFSETINSHFNKFNSNIEIVKKIQEYKGNLSNLYVIILTNYNNEYFFSKRDILKLKSNSFSGVIIQYIGGNIDYQYAKKQKIKIFPDYEIPSKKMAYTLIELGILPTLFLIIGSIKVGELAARIRKRGIEYKESIDRLKKHKIVDFLN